jgi:hypothetical protein
MAVKLILYSTSHCHLCELAESILKDISVLNDIVWTTIEITEDSMLLLRYEIKIPVIKRVDNEIEISWPFTAQEIQSLVEVNN